MEFRIHTLDSASAEARPTLEIYAKRYGFVPNLIGLLASSPAALRSYLAIGDAFETSALSAVELEIVRLAVSVENGCDYCVAAHSTVAGMVKAPVHAVEATREGRAITGSPRLESLRRFAAAVVASRGRPAPEELQAFEAAGFGSAQVLDVLTLVAMKTLSNYANHLAQTPLDAAFSGQRWVSAA